MTEQQADTLIELVKKLLSEVEDIKSTLNLIGVDVALEVERRSGGG